MENCNQILVIEDDINIREVLKSVLEFEGYSVETASNGKEGFDIIDAMKKPCLILLDLMMPIMDGWKFSELIAQDMLLSHIPIVAVTAFPKENMKNLDHVRTIIKKPVDIDLLMAQVETFCKKD
jgi:two-component system chemotaxis response regulator CheY